MVYGSKYPGASAPGVDDILYGILCVAGSHLHGDGAGKTKLSVSGAGDLSGGIYSDIIFGTLRHRAVYDGRYALRPGAAGGDFPGNDAVICIIPV